jgi:inhibitor of KinA
VTVPRISALGDSAVVVTFGDDIDPETHARVSAFAEHLDASPPTAMIEHVPAFTTVTITYEPLAVTCDEFIGSVRTLLDEVTSDGAAPNAGNLIEIPVSYGDELGPDLVSVAEHNDLTPEEIIEIHSGALYVVYMIGFAPGFPYLGGMPPRIATPRLDAPRAAVPAGSVGIAGSQTGVYSVETPGGWRLIGRTPLRLFRPAEREPSLLRAGDRVRFIPIDRAGYDALLADEVTS